MRLTVHHRAASPRRTGPRSMHRGTTSPGRTGMRRTHHRSATAVGARPRALHHRGAAPGHTGPRARPGGTTAPNATGKSRPRPTGPVAAAWTLPGLHRTGVEHSHASGELVGTQLSVLVAIQPIEPSFGIAPGSGRRRSGTPHRGGRLGPARGSRLGTARRCGTSNAVRPATRSAIGVASVGIRSGAPRASLVRSSRIGPAARSTIGIRACRIRPSAPGERRSWRRTESASHRRSAGSWPHLRHRGPELVQRHDAVLILVCSFQQFFDEVRRGVRDFVQFHAAVTVAVQSLEHHSRTGRFRPIGLGRQHRAAQGEARPAERQHCQHSFHHLCLL